MLDAPLHAEAATLPPDYFSPGVSIMHGKLVCSLWAVAYWRGVAMRFERERFGAPWIRSLGDSPQSA